MRFTHYINSLPYALEETSRVIQEAITKDFKQSNITISHDEFVILDTIYCHPGILQIDLAKKVLKTRAHTGKFLAKLVEKELVKKEKGIKGAKQIIWHNYLTDKGKNIHKDVVDEIKIFINNTMPENITDNDIEKLIVVLNKLKSDVEIKRKIKFN